MLIVHPIQPYYGLRALLTIGVMVLVRGAARGALSRARRQYDDQTSKVGTRPLLLSLVPPLDDPRMLLPRTRWLARMLAATRPLTP
jgi:hypothetical protein